MNTPHSNHDALDALEEVQALYSQGSFDKVVSLCDQLISKFPGHAPRFFSYLLASLTKLERHADCISQFRLAGPQLISRSAFATVCTSAVALGDYLIVEQTVGKVSPEIMQSKWGLRLFKSMMAPEASSLRNAVARGIVEAEFHEEFVTVALTEILLSFHMLEEAQKILKKWVSINPRLPRILLLYYVSKCLALPLEVEAIVGDWLPQSAFDRQCKNILEKSLAGRLAADNANTNEPIEVLINYFLHGAAMPEIDEQTVNSLFAQETFSDTLSLIAVYLWAVKNSSDSIPLSDVWDRHKLSTTHSGLSWVTFILNPSD